MLRTLGTVAMVFGLAIIALGVGFGLFVEFSVPVCVSRPGAPPCPGGDGPGLVWLPVGIVGTLGLVVVAIGWVLRSASTNAR